MANAVIVAATRSPIGRAHKGSLQSVRPDDLVSHVIAAALQQVPAIDPTTMDDILIGSWLHTGDQGGNIARRVAVMLGLDAVPGATVNRACASSLQTTRMAFHAIAAGEARAVVSAGVESVSRYPEPRAAGTTSDRDRNPIFNRAVRHANENAATADFWRDPRELGELPDIYMAMGQTAENLARLRGISRAEQDDFALRSQRLTADAIVEGFFAREITPIDVDGSLVEADDSPRPGTTAASLAGLPPVFRAQGTVTAGNCCPLNDGAAALIIVADDLARDLGLPVLARIVSTGSSALSPEIMGLGPVEASKRAMAHAGVKIDDIDLVEMNEAFAAQVLPSCHDLGLDLDRVNVHGGSIALGHPFGMGGARLLTTLINGLRARDGELGMATMCAAGGQGMSVLIERVA